MATITLTGPQITPPSPIVAPKQPVVQLAAEGGQSMTLRYAPRGVDLSGWAAVFDLISRPGRPPLLLRTGDAAPTASIEFLLANLDYRVDVEQDLATLKALASGGDRITLIGLSPQEAGPWRITDVAVSASIRVPGTNRVSRALVTMTLGLASDPNTTLGPRYLRKALKKAVKFTAKSGMTPQGQAHKYYGDPALWTIITKYNKMKTAKFTNGKTYTVPKYTP